MQNVRRLFLRPIRLLRVMWSQSVGAYWRQTLLEKAAKERRHEVIDATKLQQYLKDHPLATPDHACLKIRIGELESELAASQKQVELYQGVLLSLALQETGGYLAEAQHQVNDWLVKHQKNWQMKEGYERYTE